MGRTEEGAERTRQVLTHVHEREADVRVLPKHIQKSFDALMSAQLPALAAFSPLLSPTPLRLSSRRRLEERPLLRAAGGLLALCTLRRLAFAPYYSPVSSRQRLTLILPVRPCAFSRP